MAPRRKTRTFYRDTKTGRLASKATWKRSRARGGTRYKRQRVPLRPRRKVAKRPRRPRRRVRKIDWLVSFSYQSKSKRNTFTADVIVPAPSNASEDNILEEATNTLAEKFGGSMPWDAVDFDISKGPVTTRTNPELREVRRNA